MDEKIDSILAILDGLRREVESLRSDKGITFSKYKDKVLVSGNTMAVKDKLKSNGAKWNPTLKSWIMSQSEAELAKMDIYGMCDKIQP